MVADPSDINDPVVDQQDHDPSLRGCEASRRQQYSKNNQKQFDQIGSSSPNNQSRKSISKDLLAKMIECLQNLIFRKCSLIRDNLLLEDSRMPKIIGEYSADVYLYWILTINLEEAFACFADHRSWIEA